MDRNLDGVYFRVKREDRWCNVCFSDLTESEMLEVMKGKDETWLKSLCMIFGKQLRMIGDQMDLVAELEVV